MVSCALRFRSILTEEIVEDEGSTWTEGSISWISINRGSYKFKSVHVVDGDFCTSVGKGGFLSAWLLF